MTRTLITLLLTLTINTINVTAQQDQLGRLDVLLGKWSGQGTGFGNNRSTIHSEFNYVMNGAFIEAQNVSEFEPTDANPDGERHVDRGFFSYDSERKIIVYRQFHIEGYVNQYILNDSLSGDSVLVFETESIESFVPGGKARYTIHILSENEIETIFDVSFPGRDYGCFGNNRLRRME